MSGTLLRLYEVRLSITKSHQRKPVLVKAVLQARLLISRNKFRIEYRYDTEICGSWVGNYRIRSYDTLVSFILPVFLVKCRPNVSPCHLTSSSNLERCKHLCVVCVCVCVCVAFTNNGRLCSVPSLVLKTVRFRFDSFHPVRYLKHNRPRPYSIRCMKSGLSITKSHQRVLLAPYPG
jgi:hypothetical protein